MLRCRPPTQTEKPDFISALTDNRENASFRVATVPCSLRQCFQTTQTISQDFLSLR